ncbi:MAG: TaqI-like C-terminal specificity domain-containing protein, partial [Nitrospirales bacterium]
WMVNDYGRSLRAWIKERGALDRWIDFKSHQVFDEAITYTALQFFRGKSSNEIKCAFAPDGNIAEVEWEEEDAIAYSELSDTDSWHLVTAEERQLMAQISKAGKPLGDPCNTKQIFQGLITSADSVYHLKKIGLNRYKDNKDKEIFIEDEIMHPLVSGKEVEKYQRPTTETFILFPYDLRNEGRLFCETEMINIFPKAWAYLKENEDSLRKRERGKLDDAEWYRFGRNQSITNQTCPKMLVPRLVKNLFCSIDQDGEFFLDNVDVGGILPNDPAELPYLAAILNSKPANFYWRLTSKPFQNDYRAANKQFIAPIPIPDATPEQRKDVGDRAQELQELHTRRRDLVDKLDARLNSDQTEDLKPKPKPDWIWAKVGTKTSFLNHPDLPEGLNKTQTKAWSKARHEAALTEQLDILDILLEPGATLRIDNSEDEITLHINDRNALTLYDKPDTPFIAAQWHHTLRDKNVTEAYNGKKLLNDLLKLKTTPDHTLKTRILDLDREIRDLDQVITTKEHEMNEIVTGLYGVDTTLHHI